MRTPSERFFEKVEVLSSGCWRWTASGKPGGYGHFWLDGKYELSHRVSYQWAVGPIPLGLQLDHLCRNPWCVNPAHLEPVDARTNTRRGVSPAAANAVKAECKRGHPLDAVNTRWYRGKRNCRACALLASQEHRAARKTTRPRIIPDHGTDARYQRGCKCPECRGAHAAQVRRNAVTRRMAPVVTGVDALVLTVAVADA